MAQTKGGAHGSKKARNKPYRPKPALIGGGLRALVRIEDRAISRQINSSPYKEDDIKELARVYWASFLTLKMGKATEEAWSFLAASINMALLLCEDGIGEEHTPLMIAALEGMFKAKMRGERTGSYRLDGAGIAAVGEALRVHDAQMELATPNDIAKADETLQQRMRDGNVYQAEQIH